MHWRERRRPPRTGLPQTVIDFLRDLFARPGATRTVILLEQDTAHPPRQYEVRPGYALYAGVVVVLAVAAVLVAAVVLTPFRGMPVGPGAADLRRATEANAQRAAALEDSLAAQVQQIAQLRAIITGGGDDVEGEALDSPSFSLPEDPETTPSAAADARASGQEDHVQPALPLRTLGPASDGGPARDAGAADAYLNSLRLPASPPVDGVESRGFDAARGHFAVDYAATEGTPVRSIGEGYVVFADWTHDGGHTIAVQHPSGYLSVYKHNSRLLKRLGERVRTREAIALSGDTGEITSGPHLHVEVWRDGLAQDPAALFLAP